VLSGVVLYGVDYLGARVNWMGGRTMQAWFNTRHFCSLGDRGSYSGNGMGMVRIIRVDTGVACFDRPLFEYRSFLPAIAAKVCSAVAFVILQRY